MPTNPKALAIQRGIRSQREYQAGVDALDQLAKKRYQALARCLETGCTLGETAEIFGISRTRVQQMAKLAG